MFPKRKHLSNCKSIITPLFVVPSVYTTKPNTVKETDLFTSDSLVVAVTSMQGWREEMEDAYCVLLPRDSALDRHALALRRWRDESYCYLRQVANGQIYFNDSTLLKDCTDCANNRGERTHAELPSSFPDVTGVADGHSSAQLIFSSGGHGAVRHSTAADGNSRTGVKTGTLPISYSESRDSKTILVEAAKAPVGGSSATCSTCAPSQDGPMTASALASSSSSDSSSVVHRAIPSSIRSVPKSHRCISLFGVFDGHGGPKVSEVVSKNMCRWVLDNESFRAGDYEKALHDAFVKNDASVHTSISGASGGLAGGAGGDVGGSARYARRYEMWRDGGSTANVVMVVENRSTCVGDLISTIKSESSFLPGKESAHSNEIQSSKAPQSGDFTSRLRVNSSQGVYRQPEHHQPVDDAKHDSSISPRLAFSSCDEVSATYDEIKIICANAGDSRSLLIRANGLFVPLSVDHEPSAPNEAARIVAAGGTVETSKGGCSRIDGILAVSRGFGDFDFKSDRSRPQSSQQVVVTPEITTTFVRVGAGGECECPYDLTHERLMAVGPLSPSTVLSANAANTASNSASGAKSTPLLIDTCTSTTDVASVAKALQNLRRTLAFRVPTSDGTNTAGCRCRSENVKIVSRSTEARVNVSPEAENKTANVSYPVSRQSSIVSETTPPSGVLTRKNNAPLSPAHMKADSDLRPNSAAFLSYASSASDDASTAALVSHPGCENSSQQQTNCNEYVKLTPPTTSLPLLKASRPCDAVAGYRSLFPLSRENVPLCVVLACDGIWDCFDNLAVSSYVTEAIDTQIAKAVRALQHAKKLGDFSKPSVSPSSPSPSGDTPHSQQKLQKTRARGSSSSSQQRFSFDETKRLASLLYSEIVPRICPSCITEALVDECFKQSLKHSAIPPEVLSSGGGGGVLPPRPMTIGTDNMTLMLVVFKEGVAARALRNYGAVLVS